VISVDVNAHGLAVGVLCSIVGCLWGMGCGRECADPTQFQSLIISNPDLRWETVFKEPRRLAEIPHIEIGTAQTKRLLAEIEADQACHISPWKLPRLVLARLEGGREERLIFSEMGERFVFLGHRDWDHLGDATKGYVLKGSSAQEVKKVMEAAKWRVFYPLAKALSEEADWANEIYKQSGRLPAVSRWPVVARLGGKYGFLDTSSKKVLIQARFDDAHRFAEGLAAVRVGGPDEGKWGYIDPAGRFVIEPQFGGACNFSEGLAAVTSGNWMEGKQGYIDRTGKIVIEAQFDVALPFDKGRAWVCVHGKCGQVDIHGKFEPSDWQLEELPVPYR